jgi:hypothetical protein
MWRIVGGADEREIPRWAAIISRYESVKQVDQAEMAHEHAREERFSAWLAKQNKQ